MDDSDVTLLQEEEDDGDDDDEAHAKIKSCIVVGFFEDNID